MRRTSGNVRACIALAALFVVAANAWQYDPDLMANPNMGLQPPMLPNFGMDPLGVFPQPMQMAPPPQMQMMMPDPTMDFDPELSPLEPNGAPRFMQQPAVTSVVVRRNRMGHFQAVPGEEDVPAGEPCRAGEPGCGTAQVIETATTTTATPIDEDKDKERREEEERERRERKEKEDKRKREREEEEEKKKKEKEERDEKRKKEREEREERDKKEREEREEHHRKEKEEREERQRERREKRREEDEQDRKEDKDDDDDDKPHRKHKKSKKDDDDDEDKDSKKKKCSKCSKCKKSKKDDKDGGKDEASLEGPDGKTIHVVVSTKGGDDKDEDKEKGDCDKKCDDESSCDKDKEEEEMNKEDPLVAEKKKEYAKLTEAIKKDEEEFTKEADWLTKALSLIGELKQKTHNVQMHLNDMHKDMSLMERKRQRAAAELEEAEKKKGEEGTLHKLEKELDLLMSASTAANEKINMFASRKAQYLAKIGEVRNMLQQIKLSHMMTNPSAFQSMAESFRAPPPPPEIGQPNGGQEDDKMEVVPQFR